MSVKIYRRGGVPEKLFAILDKSLSLVKIPTKIQGYFFPEAHSMVHTLAHHYTQVCLVSLSTRRYSMKEHCIVLYVKTNVLRTFKQMYIATIWSIASTLFKIAAYWEGVQQLK